jgi:hypothetical protein
MLQFVHHTLAPYTIPLPSCPNGFSLSPDCCRSPTSPLPNADPVTLSPLPLCRSDIIPFEFFIRGIQFVSAVSVQTLIPGPGRTPLADDTIGLDPYPTPCDLIAESAGILYHLSVTVGHGKSKRYFQLLQTVDECFLSPALLLPIVSSCRSTNHYLA